MKSKHIFLLSALLLGSSFAIAADNELTPKEQKEGWILLFNGKNLDGWNSPGKTTLPASGWSVENGMIVVNAKSKGEKRGGDLVTKGEYSDFDLTFDFNLTPGANSGIKYFYHKYDKGGWLGQEYQVLDDEGHPDAGRGFNGNRKTASLYDVIPAPASKKFNPPGQWNTGRIVAKGNKVTHYLNGKKTVSYDRYSQKYVDEVKTRSKFKEVEPIFGQVEKGHILIQDHADEVWFKNIKIRPLK